MAVVGSLKLQSSLISPLLLLVGQLRGLWQCARLLEAINVRAAS